MATALSLTSSGAAKRCLLIERAQEIDDSLLLLSTQLIEVSGDPIGLAASALVRPDGYQQVGGSSIMAEEDPLPDTPKRSGPELVRVGRALRDAVGEAFAHVMNQERRLDES